MITHSRDLSLRYSLSISKSRAYDLEIKRKWNSLSKAAESISLIIGTFKVAKFNTWPVVLLREKLIYVNETLVYSGIRNLRRFI